MEPKNLNRLRVIIAEKNLTNKWLSEQLGVGQATISKWVQNNAQPNLEMLIKLSKLLNVDINDLIRPEEVTLDPKKQASAYKKLYHGTAKSHKQHIRTCDRRPPDEVV